MKRKQSQNAFLTDFGDGERVRMIRQAKRSRIDKAIELAGSVIFNLLCIYFGFVISTFLYARLCAS